MTRTNFSSSMLGGSSLIVIALSVAQPVMAQDTTISSSITTGTVWSGALTPGTNLTITSTGTISTADPSAITITGGPGATLDTLVNSGRVNDTAPTGIAIRVGATGSDTITVSAINNNATGTISAVATGLLIDVLGTIGALTNSGRISGRTAVSNLGSIGSVSNTGVIAGTTRGIHNYAGGRIGTIDNSGLITVAAGSAGAAGGIANNAGSILTIINTGTIVSSSSSGIGNNQTSSSIGQITNSGLISGATGGLWNSGTMSQITNTGRIIGAQAGVFHTSGTIGTIDNSGTISGGSYGISIGGGSFNSLINSGTVSGVIALYLASGVSALNVTNSGVIAGTINNRSSNALTISGGTGGTFGTLTGSTLTNKGSIVSTLANVNFVSGNLLLNDNINATGRTVSNTGANLLLTSGINVAGAFTQTSGTLEVNPLGGLIATGVATASGGTIKSNFVSTGNYLAGTYTMLGGSSLNIFGATVDVGTLANLDRSVNATGTALQLLINNDYVGGTLATASNAAALTSSSTGLYVATTGSIGTFSNTGTLGGAQFGVNNRGTIGLLSNAGRITNNNFTALWNQGSIGQLVNTGTITNSSWAIFNTGMIGTLTNSGVIAGAGNAIQNSGVITLLDNSGTMSGGNNVVAGNFGTIINSGVFKGNVNQSGGYSGSIGTIIGGTGGTVGTFTGSTGGSQGTIGADSNLIFASGALLLNDKITTVNAAASSVTVSNTGADITLSTIVNVNANFSQSAGSLNLGIAGKLAVTQAASITGGTITTGANGFSANATYLKGAAGGTLVSGGVGSNYAGVSIVTSGGFTGLSFGSTTSGNDLLLSANNIYVGDTQASIDNTGSISGTTWAVFVANTGTIGTLTNSGELIGLNDGLSTYGRISSLTNSGVIRGGQKGLGNQNTITNLTNTSTGTILGGTAAGLQNDTSMGTVTNAGLISSGSAGFASYGTLGLLSNSGSINGGPQGIYLDGNSNSGTINNSGTITSGQTAVQVSGTLGSLTNSGFIGNATNAVNVAGTLGTMVNQAGGTISGNNVVYISGSLGGLSNSGVIKGRIDNQTANNLTITGGAAGTIGTLTGTSGLGTINNTLSNLVFASGNLLLNDRIIATGRTVSNTGASLSLSSNISITGNFSQSSGTLNLIPGTSSLIVSGVANLSGGTVAASLSSTGNYLAGTNTLISGGASSSYAGATISLNTVTGLSSASSISGNSLLLNFANDYVGGSLSTISNAASLTSAATGLYVATTGTIGTMSNTGTLGGAQFGVNNRGTIGRLSNSGRITNANFTALWNQGSIGQLVNTGTITNSSWAILNSGTIGTVTNSGVITGAGVAIQNNAVIAVVNNTGTLSGQTALAGTFGTVINSGLIRGDINRSGGVIGTIFGGSAGTVGTFTGSTGTTQGTIGASGNLTFAAGALLLNDAITAVGVAPSALIVSNTGADISLSTIVNINGNFTQTAGTLNLGSTGKLVVSQAASITGGSIAVSGLSSTGNYLAGSTAGTLVAGGTGSNYTGVSIIAGGVTGLAAAATTSGNDLVLGIGNDYVGGSLATLVNAGSISGTTWALFVANTGAIGTLTNSGRLIGLGTGLSTNGSIGSLSNSGVISGGQKGLGNQSTISNLTNTSTGTILGGTAAGLQNDTSMGTLTNAGLISSGSAGFANYGALGLLSNSGSINGGPQGIYLDGNSNTGLINNSGTITAGQSAVQVSGTLGSLVNSGFIGNATNAVNVAGTLGTLVNQVGGTMSGNNVIFVSGSLGGISNSGVIKGRIDNQTANNLTITGGAAGTIGTLTGTSGLGTINNTLSNVVFASGNLLLNDRIIATGRTVSNTGASLSLTSNISITGSYNQTSGTLTVDPGVSGLAVSGVATLSGGTVLASLSSTGNYLAGATYTLIEAANGSSYAGANLAIGGVAGLGITGRVDTVGNRTNLVASVSNNYIGSTLNSIVNSNTLSTTTAVYVAGPANLGLLANSGTLTGSVAALNVQGTLGTILNTGLIDGPDAILNAGSLAAIQNSGTIAGNIVNQSSSSMTLSGSNFGFGSFTGQGGGQASIVSTSADLILTSGNMLLDDSVNVTGHALINNGAVVRLDRQVDVTGNFSQSSGALNLANPTSLLAVSGAATLSGGLVSVDGFVTTGNYLVTDAGRTVVQGGAGSSYNGVSFAALVSGLDMVGATQGTNLVLNFGNDYVGGTLATLNNTGSVSASTAVYVASTGAIGALNNSGSISGPVAIYNLGSVGTISNTGVIAGDILNAHAQDLVFVGGTNGTTGTLTGNAPGTQGTITNTLGNVVLASGALVLNDDVNVGSGTLINAGASVQLINNVNVTGNYTQASGHLDLGLSTLIVSGIANISGGQITTNKLDGTTNYLVGGSAGTLVEGGLGSSYVGVGVASGLTGLSLATDVSTTGNNVDLILTAYNDYVGGTLANLANSGTISGVSTAVYVASTGSIGTVSNSGTLDGTLYGISNQGVIALLDNSGTVSGVIGLYNTGSIGTIFNSGTLLDPPGPLAAGLNNAGDIDNLINVGTISGSTYGILNTAVIGQITNSGLIEGANAIFNGATGSIGAITNSGVIAGNIENQAASALVFSGGSGSVIGTFTGGAGSRGTITNVGGNVTFASGNLLLEDDIVATGHLVSNTGASLNLSSNTNIDGSFSQSAGSLVLASGQKLIVSGAASVTGGTVSTSMQTNVNYLAGSVAGTLIQGGAGSSYTGFASSISAAPGLTVNTAASADRLLVMAENNYIGADLASLQNTGSLSTDYPVYVATTGSLGSLTNSGTLSGAIAAIYNAGTLGPISNTGVIAGNIVNTASADLRIEGGSGSIFGTLAGYSAGSQGVITNLSSDVILSGNTFLDDQINAAGHGLVASGSTLRLDRSVGVTGNYTQAGGTLLVGVTSTTAYGQLQVSGNASLTGATVRLVPLGSNAISAGQAYAVVTSGGSLTYSNLTGSVNGLEASFSTSLNGGTSGLVFSVNDIVQPYSFTETGAARGGAAAGTGIALDAIADAGGDAATPVINSVLVPLAVLSSQDQQRGLTQLSPAQLTPHLMSVVTAPVINAIVAHQDTLLDGSNGREGGATTTGAQGQRGAVWGQLLLNSAKQNDTFAGTPYAAHSYGILVGADLAGTSTFALGGALSWSNSTGNGRGDIRGSRTKVNSLQATAYFTWKPEDLESNGFAIDGQFGLGYNFFDQQRRIDFIDESAKASFDGQHYVANLRASYTASLGKSLSVMPFAALREVHVRNGSYSENGAGDANLQVGKFSMDYLSHEIGIRLSGDLNAASGSLAPSLKIGWVHDYSNGPIPLSAVLGGVAFTSTSARGAGDGAVIGTSLPFERNDHIWFGVQYDGELRRGFQNHSASIKLKYSF